MIKIYNDNLTSRKEYFCGVDEKIDVSQTVKEIIENVKTNGDKALFYYLEKFDKATISTLRVSDQEIQDAVNSVDQQFLSVIKKAANNIKEFHSHETVLL